ncbi:MAG: beta-1,6-N-acetylglucosaminyltransferase [Pseudomonadota bacterium]
MTVGIVILAHEHPSLVGAIARSLAGQGAQVIVHLDRWVRRQGWAEAVAPACLISTRRSAWGTIGLVEASLDAIRMLLALPALSHVCLLSGSCLPLRPLSELTGFLSRHQGRDFVEARPIAEGWGRDGLGLERVTLRHPFAWKRHRWLFDRSVDLQRRFGIDRRVPFDLDLRIGSQWWCLSVPTLRSMLADPDLPHLLRFFRLAWIPDECLLQTLASRHGRIAGPPLTFAHLDAEGQPLVLHDDHAEMLSWSDYFFARKLSPWATGLRMRFLDGPGLGHCEFRGQIDTATLDAAAREAKTAHTGVLTVGRHPHGTSTEWVETARPYGVLVSEDAAFLDRLTQDLVAEAAGASSDPVRVAIGQGRAIRSFQAKRLSEGPRGPSIHGRLFAPDAPATPLPGNLPTDPRLRDYRPEQRLARLIFAESARGSVFALRPSEAPHITRLVLRDPNARIVVLDGIAEADALLTRHRGHRARVETMGRSTNSEVLHRRFCNELGGQEETG